MKNLRDYLEFKLCVLGDVNVDGRICTCFECHNDYYGDFSVVKCRDGIPFGLGDNVEGNIFIPSLLHWLKWNKNTTKDKLVKDIKAGLWWNSGCATTNENKLFIKLVERSVDEFSTPL